MQEYYSSSELLDRLYDEGKEKDFITLCEKLFDKKIAWDSSRDVYVMHTPKHFINIIWHTEDVQEVRPDLTYEQCKIVLEEVEAEHDADLGVCWATIKEMANRLFPKKGETRG